MKPELDLLAKYRPEVPSDVVPADERAQLLHRIVTTPDPVPARRAAPRRRPVLRFAVPAAALGAAAVAAVMVAAPSTAPPGTPSVAAGTAGSGAESARFVVARVETAMAATGGKVLVSTVTGFRGCDSRTVTLLDAQGRPARDRWTETCGGRPSQDIGSEITAVQPHSLLVTTVHHWDRTWSRGYVNAGADPHEGFPAVSYPEQLRAELADGDLTIVGRERVDGDATIHLRASSPNWPRSMDPQYWVDASSYLLVRSRVVKGSPEQQTPLVTGYQWLRRTPALRAQLTVPTPPGYRRTD